MPGPTNSGAGSGDRHRILRTLKRELTRHPIVTDATGQPPSTFTEIRADLTPARWGHPVEDATLRVTWFPDTRAQFVFHYSESTGFDCGWHREPNPHVDQWTHYQERPSDDAPYSYEAVSFETDSPTTLVWEVMHRLQTRLDKRS